MFPRIALVGAIAILLPSAVAAQSAIAGQVTDTTGAVLPGVTIEASSPALIEGGRAAVSDAQGRYTIDGLRPGTYKVTFTLPGFSTLIRDGIELVSNFTAAVSVQMRVGAVEEAITVTGATPLVDVQRTSQAPVMTSEMIDALPTGRNAWGVGMTLPGMTSRNLGGAQVSDVGGLGAGQRAYLSIHGSTISDTHYEMDGLNVTSSSGAGNNTSVYFDDGQFQEYTYETIGGTAESQISGVVVNMIPKEGGNTFKGMGVANYADASLYDTNYSDQLKQRGLLLPSEMKKLWDYNAGVGGPIKQDRLWFFTSVRFWGSDRTVPLTFSQPGVPPQEPYSYINRLYSYLVRFTGQANAKHKFSTYYSWMPRTRPYINTSAGLNTAVSYAPSGTMWAPTFTTYVGQVKWTSTLSSRMLAEAGYSINHYAFGTLNQRFIEPGAITKEDTVLSTQWNAGDGDTRFNYESQNIVAKLSYITGSHALKGGMQYQWGWFQQSNDFPGDLDQQYANSVPFQVQVFNSPIDAIRSNVDAAVGFFVQDAWTIGRLTINGGLRYDYLKASVPAQSTRGGTFVPARTAAAVALPDWTDWSPRVGIAYDLFGNARTALKFSVGRYVAQEGTTYPTRYNPLGSTSELRTWTDLNRDDIAQLNEIGPTRNAAFGLPAGRNIPDPEFARAYNTLINVGVQHQIRPRLSVAAGYYRRNYQNLNWTDNLLTTHADYTPVQIADPRGNGQTIAIYNLNPAKLGQVSNFDANSDQNRRLYNGFDFSVNARFARAGTLTAGLSSGLTRARTCQVDDPNSLRFCDEGEFDIPFDKNFKLAGAYPLPWGISASAVFQSVPGLPRTFTYVVSRAQIPSLTVSSVTVPLTTPGEEYLPRLNQLDVKFGKIVRYRTARIHPQIGIFNLTNAATVLSQNNSFGPRLNQVQTILDGRVVRLGVQVDF